MKKSIGIVFMTAGSLMQAVGSMPTGVQSRQLVAQVGQIQQKLETIVSSIEHEQPRVSADFMEVKQEAAALLKSLEQGKMQQALSDIVQKEATGKMQGVNEAQKQLDAQLQEITKMLQVVRGKGAVSLAALQAQIQVVEALDRIKSAQTAVAQQFEQVIEKLKTEVPHEAPVAEEKKAEEPAVHEVAPEVFKGEKTAVSEAEKPPVVAHEMQGAVELK